MEKKVLIVATVVKTHIAQFHYPTMKMLKEEGWTVEVAARNDYDNPEDCKILYCDKYHDIPFERNPFSLGNIKVYRQLKKLIDEGHYDVIHCHTPVGGVLGRLASRKARKNGTKVFYTAHGFHFYKGAPLINWILWYPVEKVCGRMTDVLFTINREDYDRARKKFRCKVVYIPGIGCDTEKFHSCDVDKDEYKKNLGINNDYPIIFSAGELHPRKNQITLIRVIPNCKIKCNLLIAGDGVLKEELVSEVKKLNIEDTVHLLGRRTDMNELYHISDIFALPSVREGLGIVGIEAMASGLPLVASRINGILDYMVDGETGYLCKPTDYMDFAKKIDLLLGDKEQQKHIGNNNKKASEKFDVKNSLSIIKGEYW